MNVFYVVLILIGNELFIITYLKLLSECYFCNLLFLPSYIADGLADICADPDSYTSSTKTQYHEFACKYVAFRQSVKK